MISKKAHLSNSVTYSGLIFSILSIYNILYDNSKMAIVFFIFAGICDMLDGKFASCFERTNEQKQFGIQLDSMCDVVSFVLLPAVFIIKLSHYSLIPAIFYVFAGIKRLTKFTVSAEIDKRGTHFIGVPVTYSALLFPVTYIFTDLWFVYALEATVLGVLFISKFKVPKNNMITNVFFILIAIITLFTLTLI